MAKSVVKKHLWSSLWLPNNDKTLT